MTLIILLGLDICADTEKIFHTSFTTFYTDAKVHCLLTEAQRFLKLPMVVAQWRSHWESTHDSTYDAVPMN